jgi:hypothetical protein
MQPFIPDNTSGQRIMEERSIGGMFRQDRFQQLHLQSYVIYAFCLLFIF